MTPTQPTSTVTINNGLVTAVVPTSSGGNWPNPPATVWVTFVGGGGWGAVGIATVSENTVTSVRMVNQGRGYTSAPTAVYQSACISVLVTAPTVAAGYAYQLNCLCGLSDGIQIVQAEGNLLVSW